MPFSDGRAAAGAESEGALLAAIVACSSDAIVSLSLDGMITSWNAAAEKLFGYAAGEIVGHSIRTLVPRARERERKVRFERALRGSAPQEWETERLRADGTALPVSVTLSAIRDRSGTPIGVVAVLRDLSERRRYRREHRIAQTLQRSLVPAELPDTPGLRFVSRYVAGAADIDVGGDWYDVIAFSPVRVGIVIGDVVGRGVEAAVAMGQLRSALPIYALDELLDHLLDPVLADDPEDDVALLAIRRLAGAPVGPDTARTDKGEQVDWRPRHDVSN
jgi:PAS domain S-box-containing protein